VFGNVQWYSSLRGDPEFLKGNLPMADPITGTPVYLASLKERLVQAQARLAAKRRQLGRSTALTLIVGLVLLGLLGFYFWYGYTKITEVTKPDIVVPAAFDLVEERIPEARKEAVVYFKKNAPTMAANLSHQAQESMPNLRKQLEETIMSQVESSVEEATLVTDDSFKQFIKEHRPTLEKAYKELADRDTLAEGTLAEIERELDKEMQSNLREEANSLLLTLRSIVRYLEYIRTTPNDKLSVEGQADKHLAMVFKWLQKKKIDPEIRRLVPAEEDDTERLPVAPKKVPAKSKGRTKEAEKTKKG
jgi:hypothetical protein